MANIGTIEIQDLFVGSKNAIGLYQGAVEVWSKDTPQPTSPSTKVKYTAASGLPDWEGDIVGEIIGGDGTPTKQIPNIYQAAEIVIGSNVTVLGDAAFYSIHNLSSMTIGNGVTSIGWQTLAYCEVLPSITIPANVTSISGYTFDGCNGLTSVTFEGFTKNEVKAMTTGSQKIFGDYFEDSSTGEPMEKSFTAVCSDGSMTIHFSDDWDSIITFTDL